MPKLTPRTATTSERKEIDMTRSRYAVIGKTKKATVWSEWGNYTSLAMATRWLNHAKQRHPDADYRIARVKYVEV